jgi:AmiR/NasT family two-component response regulator
MNDLRSDAADSARVLIVEDIALRAMEFGDVLSADGCEVVGYAHDLPSALTSVRRSPPDVALVSLRLDSVGRRSDVVERLSALGVDCVLLTEGDPAVAGSAVACLHVPCRDELMSVAVAEAYRVRLDALRERRAAGARP